MIISKRSIGLAGLALIGALSIAGCTSSENADANIADLNGVKVQTPDKIEAYRNINDHPNIVRLCIDNRAFFTTSRDAGENFGRVPEWDVSFCGATAAPK